MPDSKAEDLAVIISAGTEQLASDLSRAARLFRDFAKEAEKSSPKPIALQVATLPFKAAREAVRGVTSAAREAAASVASFASRVASTAGGIAVFEAGLIGVSGALNLVRDSVNLAAELEQTTVAFEVMLGSATKATAMVGDLRKFAADTPFNSREVTDAARQLLAYGVAADQVMPTLKVLGDVTAGLGGRTSLGDMAYLYGTLNTQGRAFSKDIYQFTNRGVQLLEPLAKHFGKTTGEIMEMVEEGRIGIPEVGRALEALRGPGGAFENMMARQSKTLKGLVEIAKDAWDIAKTKFGQIVIEEAGLKDAARDFEGFAKRVEGSVERLRPVVRFLGDLTKGVVQATYEFGRAGSQIAEMNFEGLTRAFPEFGEAMKNAREFVRDLQNLKISQDGIEDLGLSIFESVSMGIARTVDWVHTEGKEYYKDFKEYFLDPAKELADVLLAIPRFMREARDAWRGVGKAAGDAFVDWAQDRHPQFESRQGFLSGGWRNRDYTHRLMRGEVEGASYILSGVPSSSSFEKLFGPRVKGESDKAFASRYHDLQTLIGVLHHQSNDADPVVSQPAKQALPKALDVRLRNFLLPYTDRPDVDWPALNHQFEHGTVPALKAGFDQKLAEPPPQPPRPEPVKSHADRAREFNDQFRAEMMRGRADRNSREAAEAAAKEQQKVADAARDAAQVLGLFRDNAALALTGTPLNELASVMGAAARLREREQAAAAVVGGPFFEMQRHERPAGALQFTPRLSPDQIELARRLKDEYRPLNIQPGVRSDAAAREQMTAAATVRPAAEAFGLFRDNPAFAPVGSALKQLSGAMSAARDRNRNREVEDSLNGTKLGQFKDTLKALVDFGQIDKPVADMAWRDEVKKLAERFGLAGGPTQLPGAALAGSSEDARLLTHFMAGRSQQSTEDWLRGIFELLKSRFEREDRKPEAPPPRVAKF